VGSGAGWDDLKKENFLGRSGKSLPGYAVRSLVTVRADHRDYQEF